MKTAPRGDAMRNHLECFTNVTPRRLVGWALLLTFGFAAPLGARTARTVTVCPGGRFIVQAPGLALRTSPPSGSTADAIVLDESQISLVMGSGSCPSTSVRLTPGRKGTRIRARWASCSGIVGTVRLRANIDATCQTMKGGVADSKQNFKGRFTATLSRCGDGVVEAGDGEQCEPPGTATCDASCHLVGCGDHCVCSAGQTSCAGSCVDLLTDVNDCGACGAACRASHAEPLCVSGSCHFTCDPGFADCDHMAANGCEIDLTRSAANCGACGKQCSTPGGGLGACVAGVCAVGSSCTPPHTACGKSCVDLQTDPHNCGSCGNACGSGLGCQAGSCGCAAGTSVCSGHCVDLEADARNCGQCGTHCPTNETCTSAKCTCPTGFTACSATSCVDLTSDIKNCGQCGNVCTGGNICAMGRCRCPDGEDLCGAQCADRNTDPNNCGQCGHQCLPGGACVAGICECNPGQNVCSGRCVDELTDPDNCGRCGLVCPDRSCIGGHCMCAAGQTVCSGHCVDRNTDPKNCGQCGKTCVAQASCVAGVCKCDIGLQVCGAACVDLQTDTQNCGQCGHSCGATRHCVAGRCGP